MITSLPAVQFSIQRAYRHVRKRARVSRMRKAVANRRFRRVLGHVVRAMRVEPDRFWGEVFDAPSLSGRDIW